MKTLVLLISLNLIIDSSIGQSINCDWLNYSKGSDSYCSSLVNDSNNNIFVTGYYNNLILGSYNILTNGTQGRFNTFIAKFDPEGNIKWLNHFGNVDNCMGRIIKCDKENNIIMAGNFEGTINILGQNLNSLGYDDLFIVKFNNNGQKIWVRQVESSASLYIKSLETDQQGNIYVMIAGSSSYPTYFENINKKSNLLIAKYSSNGNIIWVKESIGYDAYLVSKPLSVSQIGDIYYTGSFSDTITFADSTFISKGYWQKFEGFPDSLYISTPDFFVAKLSTDGYEKWIKVIGNYGGEYGLYSSTKSNEIYVAGIFTDSLSVDSTSTLINGGNFLLEYDSLGTLLKYKQIEGCSMDNIICNNQNVLMTGMRNTDIFLDKYDLNLNLIQSIQAGGNNNDDGLTLAIDNNNSVLLGAVFSSGKFEFGKYTIENQNSITNLFIAKLDNNLVPISSVIDNNELLIFPNPVLNILKGKTAFLNVNINIKITNSIGELLIEKSIIADNAGFFEINLSTLNKGLYIITIDNEIDYISKVFIKN